jgi:hypothetical protein
MHVFFRIICLAFVILLPSVVNAQSFNPTLASLLQQKLDSILVTYQIKQKLVYKDQNISE